MSPAPRPDPAGDPASAPPFEATLTALRDGPVHATDVARLSDLGREAAARLAAAWPTWPEATRIAVVREMDELAEERVEFSFGRALRVALDDASPVVRQLAVAALWEDERSDLLDRLRALVAADPSEDVRAEAAKGLGRFAQQAATGDLDAAVGDDLRALLTGLAGDEGSPYGVRRRALESVGALGGDEVRRLIRIAYDSDDQGMQASALYAMGQGLDPRWLEIVLAALRSPEAELRFEAARACGNYGDDRAVPDLGELARDPDVEVRHAAIAALGQIGGRAALRVLRALAASSRQSDADLIQEAIEEALIGTEPLRAGPS